MTMLVKCPGPTEKQRAERGCDQRCVNGQTYLLPRTVMRDSYFNPIYRSPGCWIKCPRCDGHNHVSATTGRKVAA